MLTRLIYASRSNGLSYPDIRALNDAAAQRNAGDGLTGLLIYGSSCFLQALEGERAVVNETYRRISGDTRHRDLTLLDVSEIRSRAFADWSMRLIVIDEGYGAAGTSIVDAHGMRPFDPARLSGLRALAFLTEFHACSAAA